MVMLAKFSLGVQKDDLDSHPDLEFWTYTSCLRRLKMTILDVLGLFCRRKSVRLGMNRNPAWWWWQWWWWWKWLLWWRWRGYGDGSVDDDGGGDDGAGDSGSNDDGGGCCDGRMMMMMLCGFLCVHLWIYACSYVVCICVCTRWWWW